MCKEGKLIIQDTYKVSQDRDELITKEKYN